ncbi:MAG: multidrug effflux MFS transporter [Pseudomonadota bacterium]
MLVLLAALVALGPLSVDMYLPAMPIMMRALDTNISAMHLTMSSYLTGFAVFHLVCGPLGDRFGRRPILIGGSLLFVCASIGCTLAENIQEMMVFRFVQGVGACVGPTLARAVARDVFGPTRAARALSLIAMLMALAPAIAPALGSVLLLWMPWQIIFAFLAAYGALMILLVYLFLAESLPVKQSLHPLSILRNYGQLLRHVEFMTAAIASSMIYAGLMIYLASSSFVYIDMLGVPQAHFGLVFTTTVIGYILGSGLSARLAHGQRPERQVVQGACLASGATLTMTCGHFLSPDSIAALLIPMVLYAAGMGLTLPNAMAVALRPFPQIAGTASALLGFIQMSISASATALVGLFLKDTPAPMALMMAAVTSIALLLSFLLLVQPRPATQA